MSLGVAVLAAVALYSILIFCSLHIADEYFFWQGIIIEDAEYSVLLNWIITLSLFLSVLLFIILFLLQLGQKLAYIPKLMDGIDALRLGNEEHRIPIAGDNELTELAEAINYLSDAQKKVREDEKMLQEEKDLLIRSLSHDIRTPLTSILAYSEFLLSEENCSPNERRKRIEKIHQKAMQIRELTDLLLDGGSRQPEYFEDAGLLIAQLADDFIFALEKDFTVAADIGDCSFSGMFDVRELKRISDNLISNIEKYADPTEPIRLTVWYTERTLVLRQENRIRMGAEKRDSYQLGLKSIQRIARNYLGHVDVQRDAEYFAITITFSAF